MPPAAFTIDWAAIASQGIFAVLFVYLFLDSRNENRKREETQRLESAKREQVMRESFAMRESKFLDSQAGFLNGLHENTMALSKLTDTLITNLNEMKDYIESHEPIRIKPTIRGPHGQ